MRISGGSTIRTTAIIAAMVVGLPAALTGCGVLPGSASTQTNTCSTGTPGVTANSVKLGFIFPDTGPAEIANVFKAARSGAAARIDAQNRAGGVYGRQLDLDWGDDRSDPRTFALVAHDFVDNKKVFGLIANTIVLDDSAGWLADQDVPVTGTATSAAWSDHPNLFHSGSLFNKGGTTVFGDFVKAQGGKRALLVIDPNVPTSSSLAAQLVPSLESRGIQVVGAVTFTEGITNAARVADQLKKSGADTLVGAAQSGPFIDIYAEAKKLGVKLNVALNSSGISTALLAQRGTDMAGMSVTSPVAAKGSPARNAYESAMNTYAPEVEDPSDELAIGGYVAADEMIEGLRLAGACPTRQSFITSLRRVTAYSANGMISPVDLAQPKQPELCQNFISVDPAGRTFVPVPPPAAVARDGYWCGSVLQ
ncbi:ABC transporter substrate-binding protein [Frankia sp. AgB1.9]|uniref:ABC transporter substrate-binding protein n=1 Tax=unclassified Frankia TaxID=2632575 RepID=UPI0019322408|nr:MULTISPECIES: ABC transporter substrate-binding protein [unclassified Frankia]MBL7492181.1 ABC transporter substrate-binding protein [Frankia sp. AgW1.1]MBL7552121.1 ABC transporter substrate-binding protein [Frankia sp. AgB1.9]MBL7622160.1 ABC transporter substrate-binding protein [Frankia sp. AgB1.8]